MYKLCQKFFQRMIPATDLEIFAMKADVFTGDTIEQVCVVKADDANDTIEQSDTKMSVGVNLCHLLHRRGGGGWLWVVVL